MLKNHFIFRMFSLVVGILMHCNLKCLHVERAQHKHFTAVRVILLKCAMSQYEMKNTQEAGSTTAP